MERILCVKIASRGDLVLAAPAFRRLRECRPSAHVDLLVGASCLDVAEHLPFFDRIHTVDDAGLFAGGPLGRARATARILQVFRGGAPGRYDEICILHRDWRYSALAWLARIPVRRGFAAPHAFLTHPYVPREGEHHSEQYTRMMGCEPADPRDSAGAGWRHKSDERESALNRARTLGFDGEGRWVALGFGGGRNVKTQTALKSWPLERFRDLAVELERTGSRVVWLGDNYDATTLGEVACGVVLAGKLSVPETAAVLSACKMVVANDSLILHLADSLGVPAVGLFGPTDALHYRPRGAGASYLWPGERLACSPCHVDGYFPPCPYEHRCMTEISVAMVMARAAAQAR